MHRAYSDGIGLKSLDSWHDCACRPDLIIVQVEFLFVLILAAHYSTVGLSVGAIITLQWAGLAVIVAPINKGEWPA